MHDPIASSSQGNAPKGGTDHGPNTSTLFSLSNIGSAQSNNSTVSDNISLSLSERISPCQKDSNVILSSESISDINQGNSLRADSNEQEIFKQNIAIKINKSLHKTYQNIYNRFNQTCEKISDGLIKAVVSCSQVLTNYKPTQIFCVGCVVLGCAITPVTYSQYIVLGLLVTPGAIAATVAASLVNRSIAHKQQLALEEAVTRYTGSPDLPNYHERLACYRESLSIIGVVAAPAAFWAALSPLLTRFREFSISQLYKVEAVSPALLHTLDYTYGRIEHLIPFLLMGAIMSIKLVDNKPEHFVKTFGPTAGMLSERFTWLAGLREWIGKEFKDTETDPSVDVQSRPEKIDIAHSVLRSISHSFNHAAVSCSKFIFTGNKYGGRVACVGLTVFGWAIPPEVYSCSPLIGPCLGIIVASAALSGSIVASAVNRAIHYNDIWKLDEGVAWSCSKFGTERFRKSLSVAGSVLGPASFWAAISPVLTQGREFLIGTSTSTFMQTFNYGLGIAEHFVPFLLAYGLMNLKMVKIDPDRFVSSMSATAGMLSAVIEGPFVSLRAGIISSWQKFTNTEKKGELDIYSIST